jgi:outer membrane lipoprotein-sorting protein
MKNILTSLLIILSLYGFAQYSNQKGDKKSKEILEKFKLKSESYKNFSAEFTYKMENKEADISESKEGSIRVQGNSYVLDIAGQKVISDGNTVWTYIKDVNEVQINEVSEDDESLTPAKILTYFDDKFRSKLIESDLRYGSKAHIIDMIPIEGKSYYKIRLIITAKDYKILEFTIYDKNGSTFSYVIHKFHPNQPIDSNIFTFNEKDHPGVDVIDMR